MSSNPPAKQAPKMCKSPKAAANFQQQSKPEKIVLNEYESLNTNCTTVGSNNLHLVKKPQLMTNMSPAYSNPSPSYPHSPYSSPAGLKSPSPQHMKPPTPQPTGFPVMQIIHNNHPLLARPIQASQPQGIIKLKPHLNILPKPSASPQPSPKPSVSPQIVIPTNQQATIMPTAQPLLLNQMPVLTTPSVQFILRPQATKIPAQMQTATATPQGLILQPSNQPLLHIQPPRSQPLVRVLTNGVQLAPPTTTYVTQLTHPPQNNSHIAHSPVMQTQPTPLKKKPKKKSKQKLDLANIMKLSGIGDEDDIQFESDTSQSESEPTSAHSQPNTPQPQQQHQNVIQPHHNLIQSQQNIVQTQANILHDAKKIGNIQISALSQPPINAATTPLVQVLNQSFQSIPTSQAATAQASIPFNPFITPNFTINNGLMVQRSGGFKLTLGEDGRLILQHDPTLNQDLQSQLLLQSIFGLNGLVLQPSIDQQVHSQTVQTIQQQSVQTIQQQTVQSQTIQTVQQQTVQPHSLQAIQPQIQTVQPQTMQQTVQQTIQHQTVQSQPLPAAQPMQIVQPQPIQNLNQSIQSQTVHSIQSQVQPTLHSIQSQIQSLLQSQLHSQNISQSQPLPIQTMQSQSIQSVQSQPLIVHSQPMQITHTVQSQPLQSIQTHCSQALPQTMHSQSIQTVQPQPIHQQQHHSVQSQASQSQPLQSQPIQSQPVLKVQPFQKSQPPVQTVHPLPAVATTAHTLNHHPQNSVGENQSQNAPPTSYVVNLTPDQLEQLKRNGQLTVNGQTIFMQRPNSINKPHHEVNASPDGKAKLSPKIKPEKKKVTKIAAGLKDNGHIKSVEKTTLNNVIKEPTTKSSLVSALQSPPKHIVTQNHVLQVQPPPPQPVQPIIQKSSQPSALVQPSVQTTATTQTPHQPKIPTQQPKGQVHANILPAPAQPTQNNVPPPPAEQPGVPTQDVERLLGQIIEDSGGANAAVPPSGNAINSQNHNQSVPQRVHTIQLTPQKQQHLKSIQLQIQTLSARLTPGDTEMHNALKLLFQEQQKILATGKLLPPEKVYYHNNQLTIVNPSSLAPVQNKTEPPSGTGLNAAAVRTTTGNDTPSSHQIATTQTAKLSVPPECNVPVTQSNITTQPLQNVHNAGPRLTTTATISTSSQSSLAAQPQPSQQHRFLPSFTKAQLIEQQLNTDQNGAIKPDVYSPFRDKADACKRLIRYHCFDQHVLSQKDLNKADEIFELTAKHFIDKFSKMVDKYRFLRMRESQREVQTSELMMLDRMFLAEEQQSLIRLRQDTQDAPLIEITPPSSQASGQTATDASPQEEYDEWACIQRELGCLPITTDETKSPQPLEHLAPKRSASSDSRLETLKRFRVDKHQKKTANDVVVVGGGAQTANLLNVPNIVSPSCAAQDSQISPGGMRAALKNVQSAQYGGAQHVMRSQQCANAAAAAPSSQVQHGMLPPPPQTVLHGAQQHHSSSMRASQQTHGGVHHHHHHHHHHLQQPSMPHISAINPPGAQNQQNSQQLAAMSHFGVSQGSQQRTPQQHCGRQVAAAAAQQNSTSQRLHNMQQHFSAQHIVQSTLHATQQHITHTVHHTQHIQHHNTQHGNLHNATATQQHSVHQQNVNAHNVHSSYNVQTHSNAQQNNDGTDNIIDEQVQSAIDSILNLQQSSIDLEDAVNSILS